MNIEIILDQCLEDIQRQRASVADCLAQYPEWENELAPLLEMAVTLEAVPEVKPSAAFKERTRRQIMNLPVARSHPQSPYVSIPPY